MRFMSSGFTAALAIAATASIAAGQHAVHIEGDNITMRGCVAPVSAQLEMPFETLIWSRGGILTAGTQVADAARARVDELAGRVFYWIDDDDLAEHTGRIVEVRGELEDLEVGELEIERDGDFTEIKLKLDGDEQRVRVPTSWLSRGGVTRADRDANDDVELDIAARKIDIDEVKVIGDCIRR